MGLAISQRLAGLMGGELSVRSAHGEGSVFSLALRLSAAEPKPSAIETKAELPHFELHALLVEDHKVNQMVARKLLSKLGVTIDLAEDGIEAVAKVDPERHQVVFMDLHMPRMNGWDATQRIREREADGERIPIIALTADADVATGQRALREGMDAHLAKPLRLQEVAHALERLRVAQPV